MANHVRNELLIYFDPDKRDEVLEALRKIQDSLGGTNDIYDTMAELGAPLEAEERAWLLEADYPDLVFNSAWGPLDEVQRELTLYFSTIDPTVVIENSFAEEFHTKVGVRLTTVLNDEVHEFADGGDPSALISELEEKLLQKIEDHGESPNADLEVNADEGNKEREQGEGYEKTERDIEEDEEDEWDDEDEDEEENELRDRIAEIVEDYQSSARDRAWAALKQKFPERADNDTSS